MRAVEQLAKMLVGPSSLFQLSKQIEEVVGNRGLGSGLGPVSILGSGVCLY